MKIRLIIFLVAISISSALSWGQTMKMTATMQAVLSNGTLTITTTQTAEAMPDYTWDNPPEWLKNNIQDNIQSVVIGENITTIGDRAFYSCVNLHSVTISGSVTRIGKDAFNYCIRLASLTIPDAVTTLDDRAFNSCVGMEIITIPASVSYIGTLVFDECTNLTAIHVHTDNHDFVSDDGVLFDKAMTRLMLYPAKKSGTAYVIPETVKIIEDGAFNKSGLKSITIPNSVMEIKYQAFWGCSELTSVTIPNAVKTIGAEVFQNCESLSSIVIPASVEEIGNKVFGFCKNLTAIEVDASNTAFSSGAGVLYNKDKSFLHTYPGGKSGAFAIPSTVESVGNNAFTGSVNLTSVTIPTSVSYIGNESFTHCEKLTSFTMPNSVENIGTGMFSYCVNLESVTLSDALTIIPYGTFYVCNSLTSITIPHKVTRIDAIAFLGCENLTTATIPEAVTEIGWGAFKGCTTLKTVLLPASLQIIRGNAFEECAALQSITIPGTVTEIQESVFSDCIALKDVTVEWDTPLTVHDDLFHNVNTSAATLHVPPGFITRYRAANVWKTFGTFDDTPSGNEHISLQSLKAFASDGLLYISGILPGQPLYIYNIVGQLIYQGLAKVTEEHIALNARGIYIVATEEQTVKVRN